MQKLFIIYLMPLRNTDKTTRNRNKKNLSKLVILPTLDPANRAGDVQTGVCATKAWALDVPQYLSCHRSGPPETQCANPHTLCNVSV